MTKKALMIVGVVLMLALLVGGCAKKQVSSSDAGVKAGQGAGGAAGAGGAGEGQGVAGGKGMGAGEVGLTPEEQAKRAAEEKARLAAEEQVRLAGADQAKRQALITELKQAVPQVDTPIYFNFDSSELLSPSRDNLQVKANALKKYADLKVVIEGHCDERGTDEYNLALGERRAKAAFEFLMMMGIDAGRLQIISYGEEKPAVAESNEEAWAKNRRDEFKLF